MGCIGLIVVNFVKVFGMIVVYNDVYWFFEDKEKEFGVIYFEFD